MSSKNIDEDPKKWVDLFGDYLFGFAKSRGLKTEEAEDIVQETFFSAFKSISGYRGDSSLKTWLVAILKRKIMDHYRKKYSKKKNLELDELDVFQQEGIFKGHWEKNHAPASWSLENVPWEDSEFKRIFDICLQYLPEKWALVFSMKVIQDYDSEELCKELEISSSNFWVIMHRARLRLRECIEKQLI